MSDHSIAPTSTRIFEPSVAREILDLKVDVPFARQRNDREASGAFCLFLSAAAALTVSP